MSTANSESDFEDVNNVDSVVETEIYVDQEGNDSHDVPPEGGDISDQSVCSHNLNMIYGTI